MKSLARISNPKGKVAIYAVPAATIAALSAGATYALTRDKSTTITSAVIGGLLGVAVVGYMRR